MRALPTFRRWLKRQAKRDGPIGDIARDVCSDTCANRLQNYHTTLTHIVTEHFACNGALDALFESYLEWREIARFPGNIHMKEAKPEEDKRLLERS